MTLLMTQTQSIQRVKVGQIQYYASHICIFMWLNRYPVSVICEIWSHINSYISQYYHSVLHTNDIELEIIQSFNSNSLAPFHATGIPVEWRPYQQLLREQVFFSYSKVNII
jgi:hypothetical protein